MAIVLGTGLLAILTGVAFAGLPDRRGYELVSPPNKNGGDVMAVYYRVRSAVDGSAAVFSSLSASGDAIGTGVATEYLSQRTGLPGTQGWASHAITPPQPAMTYPVILMGVETSYRGEFSADLSKGVIRAWSPLTDDPSVANVANLYLREDLRAPGQGTYSLVTACPVCGSPFLATQLSARPLFVDASSDFGHLLFESPLGLTAGAGTSPTGLNAYEWDHGTVRLVAILPNGQPAPASAAGGWSATGTTSYLGERAISDDGRHIFFSAPPDASNTSVYMRLDHAQTVQLNASERTLSDIAQAARFQDASNDGTHVFFTTTQALTDDAPINGNTKLYMYDATKPASDAHNLTYINLDIGPGDVDNDLRGIIGASPDGRTVYFIDRTQLVPGDPPTTLAIFAWHDGTISYVSDISLLDVGELRRDSNADKLSRIDASGDLLFTTHLATGPTGYDQGGCGGGQPCGELYLYQLATHTLRCVSCNPTGAPATTEATDVAVSGRGGSQPTVHEARAITDDGSKVFFTTAEALVPEDVNNTSDAYEYDAITGQLHLISSGANPSPSYSMDMTPDGSDVFFVTRQRLLGWDIDDNYDLYDARVNGGLAEPPAPAPACSGRACHGAPSAAPSQLATGSTLISGSGNTPRTPRAGVVRSVRRCRRGRVRKVVHGKVRCVVRPRRHVAAKQSRRPGVRTGK